MNANIGNNIQAATLITNARITDNPDQNNDEMVLSYPGRFHLWLYRQGFETIFGYFYRARSVIPLEANNEVENPTFQLQQERTQQFAVKSISVARYNEGHEREDPLNEISVSMHIKGILRGRREGQGLLDNQIRAQISQDLLENRVLLPMAMVSNETQPGLRDEDRQWFILSQLANGGDLWQFISQRRQNPDGGHMASITNLFRQMVKSVHFLHSVNVFHSDLSPENFVISNNEERQTQSVFVIDFGQAKIFPEGNETIENPGRFGKDAYLAPEVVDLSREIDWKKADVWALGITLYFMLFQDCPQWTYRINEHNERVIRFTNTSCPVFQAICDHGRLEECLGVSNIDFLPAHDLLQNMLMRDPERRYSTQDILDHEWLREE